MPSTTTTTAGRAFIYDDYGAGEFSKQQLKNCLTKCYPHYQVEYVTAEQIKSGILDSGPFSPRLLCLGGGFDLGYLERLGDIGCARIRLFVETGGFYVGICAGGYFGAESLKFDEKGPLEVVGQRPLKFFPGVAIGPINKKFQYQNMDDTSIATRIQLEPEMEQFWCYLNGGCYFEPTETSNEKWQCLARYENGTMAIVKCSVGKGAALLSGVHFEFKTGDLDAKNENLRANLLPCLSVNQSDVLASKLFGSAFNIA